MMNSDLGLVDLDVDQRREGEHAALHRLLLQSLANSRIWSVSAVEARMNSTGNSPAAGERRRSYREHLDAGDCLQLLLHLGHDLEDVALALIPWFGHHAAEAGVGEGDLEGEVGLRNAP